MRITILNINTKSEEKTITVLKNNNVLVLNKLKFFEFLNYFYQIITYKKRDVQIKIDNKILDHKNTILLSLCDFTEILGNLEWKKGTLLYEYITTHILESSFLDNDILFYNINNILENIIDECDLDIDYEIDDDISKILFNCTEFQLNYKWNELIIIFSKLLNNLIKMNPTKHFLIFYDSDLLYFDSKKYDHCYSFNISKNIEFENYNLICEQELVEFNAQMVLEKLENIWPIEFNNEKVKKYIKEFFIRKTSNNSLIAYSEHEYLAYIILNKIYNFYCKIETENFIIGNNVKSFLAKI